MEKLKSEGEKLHSKGRNLLSKIRPPIKAAGLPCAAGLRHYKPTSWAHFLMTVTCAVSCVLQCWTLLQLHLSEPVAVTIAYTPWEDVQVPGFTICPPRYDWRRHTLLTMTKVPVSRSIWKANGFSISDLLSTCEPGCATNDTVGYPGGYSSTKIGMWRSWLSQDVGAVCHTLITNISWGQLVDMSSTKKTQLKLKLRMTRLKVPGFQVFVHPRRRPVPSSHGIRGLQQDTNFEYMGENQVSMKIDSSVLDRESLSRTRCNSEVGYHFEKCSLDCAHFLWVKESNCSTPDMMEDFPHLKQCSQNILVRMERTHALSKLASNCTCLPSCRQHRIDTTITSTKILSNYRAAHDPYSVFIFSLAPVPEMVMTERRSYRLPSLLSEMGGFISLMMGVSVLSVSDMLTGLLKKVKLTDMLSKISRGRLPRDGGVVLSRSNTERRMKSVQRSRGTSSTRIEGRMRLAFTVSSDSG